jgi:hypothetical protein
MDVSCASRFAMIALLMAAMSSASLAQARRSSYDPASPTQSSKPRQGFIDFTLGRINSSDKDYGQCIAEGRKLLLHETLENGYFWSNVAALSLLGCLFVIIVYQHRIQIKREWTTAEMLAQYEHALSRANAQVDETAKKNLDLMEALTLLKESALRSPALTKEATVRPAAAKAHGRTTSTQEAQAMPPKNGNTTPDAERPASAATVTRAATQAGLFKPDVDLIMKVNSLEQQLGRSQDETKLLRRQLNNSDRRLQDEQQKNRTLKGE